MRLWERLGREMGPVWPRLIVAGKRGWRAAETVDALGRADSAAPYAWVEAPTDEELAWLYSRAAFTVFPSLAEGWGLPIGESLWFGKPCVASNAASMPEVGGSLCSYADPRAIDSFAEPIIRLVRDADFHRASVAAIHASRLRTWRETADALLAATLPVRPRGAGAHSGEVLATGPAG
jgi:glycosyltransferase involved in cell wall biosynthesis